jgi:hypothetical protein
MTKAVQANRLALDARRRERGPNGIVHHHVREHGLRPISISIPQASIDLALYQERVPGNMIYDRQEKAYVASSTFAPVVASPDVHSFLNQIRQVEGQMQPRESTFLGWYPPSGVVRHPTCKVDATTLRIILQSMRRKESVCITYQSMNQSDSTDREIGPHAIGFDGIRWHARAYCFKH